ncbi:hypothetical protein [Proteus vulgaris]|uniref:hypothetical protein n=1 Tax=Proteus vulgaris TaxID=585 RepID=UPI003459A89C
MNITSIFRDTVNQLTIGAGKVINNIVDFFSNISSGITGIFNSNTPFRQATTVPSFISHTPINFVNNKDELIKRPLEIINEFLNKCENENNSNMIENKCSEVAYFVTTSNDKPYYNTLFEGLIHNTPSERHIYSIPFEDHIYSIPFEDHIYNVSFEDHIYSIPFEDHTYDVPSKENIDDTPPTESKIMESWDFLLKNKTKFNTI